VVVDKAVDEPEPPVFLTEQDWNRYLAGESVHSAGHDEEPAPF
jgi:hypothetical protein